MTVSLADSNGKIVSREHFQFFKEFIPLGSSDRSSERRDTVFLRSPNVHASWTAAGCVARLRCPSLSEGFDFASLSLRQASFFRR